MHCRLESFVGGRGPPPQTSLVSETRGLRVLSGFLILISVDNCVQTPCNTSAIFEIHGH